MLLIILLGLGLSGCGEAEMERAVFTVEGMHCESCSSAIVSSMQKHDGVVLATADHETGLAEVTYRAGSVDVGELGTEIKELGYTVTGVSTEKVDGSV